MKRVFDIVLASSLFLILLPVAIFVALLIFVVLGRPVLFIQTRPGLGGSLFSLVKFRSMLISKGDDSDAIRLTRFGKLLRSTSLDELPSLVNVLIGDMSLVGPRPLLTEYLPLYSPEQTRRHNVKPGITGWAQVNGRNELAWHRKFELDVWYVDNRSMMLDLRIIAMTVSKVICRKGVTAEGQATMSKFEGSDNS